MEVTLTFPTPKFKIGDIIRFTQKGGIVGIDITARIHSVEAHGVWRIHPEAPDSPDVRCDQYVYHMTCLNNSLNAAGRAIRPGTITLGDVEEMDEVAEKVDYKGEILSPDTAENLMERWKNWDQSEQRK